MFRLREKLARNLPGMGDKLARAHTRWTVVVVWWAFLGLWILLKIVAFAALGPNGLGMNVPACHLHFPSVAGAPWTKYTSLTLLLLLLVLSWMSRVKSFLTPDSCFAWDKQKQNAVSTLETNLYTVYTHKMVGFISSIFRQCMKRWLSGTQEMLLEIFPSSMQYLGIDPRERRGFHPQIIHNCPF